MDNLQRHYLEQLKLANEAGLHGDVLTCLNICFELRLKSDLALYIRGHVNITLAEYTRVQTFPDKSKFAEEALRIARELKADHAIGDNSFWKSKYDNLEDSAVELLGVCRQQEKSYEEHWQTSTSYTAPPAVEDQMKGLKISGKGLKEDEEDEIEPWELERAFSVVPASDSTVTAAAEAEGTVNEEKRDLLPELIALPTTGRSGVRSKTGLPTPAPSSDVEDEDMRR